MSALLNLRIPVGIYMGIVGFFIFLRVLSDNFIFPANSS